MAGTPAAARLAASLASGDTYGALQTYRTIIKRKLDGGSLPQARDLLVDGAAALFAHGKAAEGLDLGDMLLKTLLVGAPLDAASVDAVGAVAGGVPPGPDNAKAKAAFLRSATKWASAAPGAAEPANAPLLAKLHALTASACEACGPEFYADAQRHYLEAESPVEFAAFLAKWAATGNAREADLFVVRAVLQLLCLGDLAGAHALAAAAGWEPRPRPTPASNFVRFLLLTLERDAAPLLRQLRTAYAPLLSSDPELDELVGAVGRRFYGASFAPAPRASGLESMMASMMGGGSGGGGGMDFAKLLGGMR